MIKYRLNLQRLPCYVPPCLEFTELKSMFISWGKKQYGHLRIVYFFITILSKLDSFLIPHHLDSGMEGMAALTDRCPDISSCSFYVSAVPHLC